MGSPIIVTAGQQEQGHGLTEPMLYDPLVPIAQPLVKWAVEVTRLQDLPRIVHRAAKVAMTPPTGPVFISLPGDILNEQDALELGRATRVDTAGRRATRRSIASRTRLLAARRPVIVAGHEIATSDALEEAARIAELLGAPVYQQTVCDGAHFLSEHPAFLGALTRDQRNVRDTLSPYDLMFCIGSDVLRMSVYSETDPMPEGMAVVQLGLRTGRWGELPGGDRAPRRRAGDPRRARPGDRAKARPRRRGEGGGHRCAGGVELDRKARGRPRSGAFGHRRHADASGPRDAAHRGRPAEDAVIVEEGILSARALPALFPFRDAKAFFGLGSGGIGFAMAGAVGVQLALPDRPVIAVVGDGSAMYSIQALWTAANSRLPITYVIANNGGYRLIKERLKSFHGVERYTGMEFKDPPIDFVGLARSMGAAAMRITDPDEIGPAIDESTRRDGPTLLDVVVDDGFGNEGRWERMTKWRVRVNVGTSAGTKRR